MLAYAKANPGKIAMGVSDSVTQVIASSLEKAAGIEFTIVPYKGGGPQSTDLLGNQIAAGVATPNLMPHVQSGKLQALVATTPKRYPFLPETPTVAEAIPGSNFDIHNWYAIAGPAKLPQPIVARLHAAILKVMALPEVRKRFDDLGVTTPGDTSPEMLLATMKDYQNRMSGLIKAAGIKPE